MDIKLVILQEFSANSYKVKFDIMLLTNIGMSSSWSIRKQLMLWVELDVQMKSVRKHATKY